MGHAPDLGREIEIARELQTKTLPDYMPVMPGYDMAGQLWPTAAIGGDTYDLAAIEPHILFLLLADATGHGIGPALSALQVQSMLRVALRLGADLDDSFRHINAQMVEDLPDDRFVTACFGLLDTRAHRFDFHSAGQGPILHYHSATGQFEWYGPSCYPLGILEHEQAMHTRGLILAPGDILGLISDGIFEYENQRGEPFGKAGVESVLSAHRGQTMEHLVSTLYEAAQTFAEGVSQQDDITIVFLQRSGGWWEQRSFARDLAQLNEVFAFTEAFFSHHAIDASLSSSVELALDELFSNMVNHNPDPCSPISIELRAIGRGLSVQMSDSQAIPFDVLRDAPVVDTAAAASSRAPGGLGLHLVRQMVDSLDYEYRDGHSIVRFSKEVP